MDVFGAALGVGTSTGGSGRVQRWNNMGRRDQIRAVGAKPFTPPQLSERDKCLSK